MRTALFAICWFLVSILFALVKGFNLSIGWRKYDIPAGVILVVIVGIMLFRDWRKNKLTSPNEIM